MSMKLKKPPKLLLVQFELTRIRISIWKLWRILAVGFNIRKIVNKIQICCEAQKDRRRSAGTLVFLHHKDTKRDSWYKNLKKFTRQIVEFLYYYK